MLNPEEALHILSNFSDFSAFRDLYHGKVSKSK